MRIVNIIDKTVPFASAIRNSVVDFSQMTGSVVAIVSDVTRNGKPLVGYGFNSIGRYAVSSLLRDRFIPRLMNAPQGSLLDESGNNLDPFKIKACLMRNEKPGGHGERAHAVGCIDMAVWDLIAKIEEKPLWKMLSERFNGGKADDRVFTYAAGGYYYPDKGIQGLKDELAGYLDQGFTHVKIKIGGASLSEDMARLEAAVAVVGRADRVAVDANGRFGLEAALEYGKALSAIQPLWYEEPGDPLDYRLNAVLCEYYTGPIATGENLFSLQDARNLLRYGGMRPDRDFIQVDPPLSYGLTEYMALLQLMRDSGWSPRRCIPHGGNQLSLNLAAGLQMFGNECYPGVFQPFGGYADSVPFENSYVRLPDIPGVGFEAKNNLYAVLKELV